MLKPGDVVVINAPTLVYHGFRGTVISTRLPEIDQVTVQIDQGKYRGILSTFHSSEVTDG